MVQKCSYGKCLVATDDLRINSIVEKFSGPIVSFNDIPNSQICYVLLVEKDRWMIPKSKARYINHSYSPNCIIDDNLYIYTTRNVFKGEELTIGYNFIRSGEYPGEWDERWSFKCNCNSQN